MFFLIFSAEGEVFAKKKEHLKESGKTTVQPGAYIILGSSSIIKWEEKEEWRVQDVFSTYPIAVNPFPSEMNTMTMAGILKGVNTVIAAKPAKIFIYAGSHDINRKKRKAEQVFEDISSFSGQVAEKLPECRVYWISCKPSRKKWPVKEDKALNDLVRSKTQKDGNLIYIDIWTPLMDGKKYPEQMPDKDLFSDDNHFSAKGYRIWNNTIRPYIDVTPEIK
jgi:hypothetical protein